MLLKTYFKRLFHNAYELNQKNILDACSRSKAQALLDLGCDDGRWTLQVARAAGAASISGIEKVEERAQQALQQGIQVHVADLNGRLPYGDRSFDLVHANQVIEHLSDLDTFAADIHRVLRPGGRAIVSTENGSSWHNIVAAILGWQAFSSTNMSRVRAGIGNPLALLRDTQIEHETWTHKVIFNYRGLIEFFDLHRFEVLEVKGAGYYPLPAIFGAWDPRHAHFLTIVVRRRDE